MVGSAWPGNGDGDGEKRGATGCGSRSLTSRVLCCRAAFGGEFSCRFPWGGCCLSASYTGGVTYPFADVAAIRCNLRQMHVPIETPHIEWMEVLTGRGACSEDVLRQIFEVT